MENESLKEELKGMVETIRRVPAMRRRKNIRYAYIVKVGYEEIQKLRDDGYSYDTIRDDLVARGVFEEGAESGNLCSAFLRERKRRERSERPGGKEDKKPRAAETKAVIQEVPKPEPAKPKDREKPEERESVRKITGSTEETGLGKLTKHSDGSFDFDWK